MDGNYINICKLWIIKFLGDNKKCRVDLELNFFLVREKENKNESKVVVRVRLNF